MPQQPIKENEEKNGSEAAASEFISSPSGEQGPKPVLHKALFMKLVLISPPKK
jgi:hypothetical protein